MHQNKIVDGSQARGVNKYKNLRQNWDDWRHLNQRVSLDREEYEEFLCLYHFIYVIICIF